MSVSPHEAFTATVGLSLAGSTAAREDGQPLFVGARSDRNNGLDIRTGREEQLL